MILESTKEHTSPVVITLGTATRDTIVQMAPRSLERMLLHNAQQSWLLLESGTKVEAEFIKADAGGAAINTGVNFRRQGFQVKIIAKLGYDLEAEFIKDVLNKEGITSDHLIQTDELPTARSAIVVAGDHNPNILVDRGANGTMQINEIKEESITSGDFLYIGNLSNKSASVAPWAAKLAAKHGLKVFLNPGIRQISRYPSSLKRMLADIDILAINRTEAVSLAPALIEKATREHLAKGPLHAWLQRRSFSLFNQRYTYFHVAKYLFDLGIHTLVITDGSHGAFTINRHGHAFHCPVLPSTVVSTIGAGDAFNSTLVARLLRNDDPGTAMQCATLQAASVVKHLNTQDGLLDETSLLSLRKREAARLLLSEQEFSLS